MNVTARDESRIKIQLLDPSYTYYYDAETSETTLDLSGSTLSLPWKKVEFEALYSDRYDAVLSVSAGFEYSLDDGATWDTGDTPIAELLFEAPLVVRVRKSATFTAGTYSGNLTLAFTDAPVVDDLTVALTATVAEYGAAIEHIAEHGDAAAARVMFQFKNAEKFVATIRNIGERYQPIEDALYRLNAFFDIDAATGINLDIIGEIVGRYREGGQTDESYRAFLKAQIAINSSAGTLPDIVTICRIFLGDDCDLLVAEIYPAEIDIFTDAEPTSWTATEWAAIADALDQAAPAGVGVGPIMPLVSGAFGFEDDDTALGFDEGGWIDELAE